MIARLNSASVRMASFALALALVGGLLYGGAQPAAVGLFDPPWDKVAHFAVFGALTGLLAIATRFRRIVAAGAFAALVGIADELLQLRYPGRAPDPSDIAADLFGIVFAMSLLAAVRYYSLAQR